jgi:hypothetical protein
VLPKDCDRTKPSNLPTGILRNACEIPPKRVTRAIEKPKGSGILLRVRESVKLTEGLSDEIIKQELAVLRVQVAKKKKLAELKTLRKRLAGEIFTSRNVSSLSERPRKRLRAKTPPIFTGKSLRELHKYNAAWKIFLETSNEKSEPEQIRLIITFLRDIPQNT